MEDIRKRLAEIDKSASTAFEDMLPPEDDPIWGAPGLRNKYQRDTVARLLQALCSGKSRPEAMKWAGISYATYLHWMQDDSKMEFQYWVSQSLAYRREVSVEKYRLTIESHASEDWRAAAWLAERLDPQNYGNQSTVHVDGHLSSVANMTFEQAYMLKYGKAPEYPGLEAGRDLREGDGC